MTCSECRVERPDFHCKGWWLAWAEWNGWRFCVISFELDPAMAREPNVKHLCGESCLHKTLSKYTARKLVGV